MRRIVHTLILAVAVPAGAQVMSVPRAGTMTRIERDDSDRAMLGITTSTGGVRDTLGVLVSGITPGGPADKAGLLEGDRIQSINGMNLKLRPDDAADPYMRGINQNRLTREMRKVRPGDDVTLEVWSGGRARTAKVHTVSADALGTTASTYAFDRARTQRARDDDNRAVLGVYLGATGTKRDTAGVFVERVVEGGPAEKAGIVEGDRVASINGVDVRVAREDAGDDQAAAARVDRVQRELGKLKAGDVATLEVVSGGRTRTVRVTTAKPDDVPGMGWGTFGPGPAMQAFPLPNGRGAIMRPNGGTIRVMPRIELRRPMDGEEMRSRIEEGLDGLDGLRDLGPTIRAEIRDNLDRELPRAMDELDFRLNDRLPRMMDALRDSLNDAFPRRMDALREELRALPRKMEMHSVVQTRL